MPHSFHLQIEENVECQIKSFEVYSIIKEKDLNDIKIFHKMKFLGKY
jgi:hypothetical protein